MILEFSTGNKLMCNGYHNKRYWCNPDKPLRIWIQYFYGCHTQRLSRSYDYSYRETIDVCILSICTCVISLSWNKCNMLCKCIILECLNPLLYDYNYIPEHKSTDRNIFFTKLQNFYIMIKEITVN